MDRAQVSKLNKKKKLTWSSLWARPTLAGTSKSKTRSSNGCEFTFEVKIALAVIFGTLPVNCLLSGFHYFKLLRILPILPTVASCILEILPTPLKIVYCLAFTILNCLGLYESCQLLHHAHYKFCLYLNNFVYNPYSSENCLLFGFHYFKLLRFVPILPTIASCLLRIFAYT